MAVARDPVGEALATARGFLFLLVAFCFFPIILAVIALDRIRTYGPLERFQLGNTDIPWMYGSGASNLDVLIFSVAVVVALIIGIVIRYYYFREKIDFLRSKGMTDLNKDGQIDSFADDHIDDFR